MRTAEKSGRFTTVSTGMLYEPYGQPLNPATATPNNSATPTTRGNPTTLTDAWAGIHQRAYEHTATLNQTHMGARTYLPAYGCFTTTDPIPGGNTTPYTYPQDPINGNDYTGLARWNTSLRRNVATGLCYTITLCALSRHGTYTASFNGGVAGASISFTQHGGHPRFYIQPGYTLTRKVPGRAWIGYSVGWSPGSPNERVKFGVGAALCRKYCLGGQTGYKGLGTYRGLSPFVGMGNGTSGWVSGGVRVPERGGLW